METRPTYVELRNVRHVFGVHTYRPLQVDHLPHYSEVSRRRLQTRSEHPREPTYFSQLQRHLTAHKHNLKKDLTPPLSRDTIASAAGGRRPAELTLDNPPSPPSGADE